MSPSPKINISAIMNKKNAKNTEKPIKVEDTVILEEPIKVEESTKMEEPKKIIAPVKVEEEVISKIPHISISSIKTSKSPAEKKEIIEEEIEEKHESKKEELIETLENYTDNQTEKLSNDKTWNIKEELQEKKVENDEKVENSEKEESLEEIEAKINKKVEEETKEKFKLNEKELKSDEKEKELFWNYQSDFKEKEVIETIKEKKKAFKERLKEPKTRILLVFWLLILTIWSVTGLFVLDPSNHSFEIYKKWILNNVSKINLNKININTNVINDTWVAESINVESISFNIFTQKRLLWWVNYKYKDIVYKTKLELETVIKNEINEENAAKLAEKARLEAERAKLEAEKIMLEKKEQTNAKIKNVLLNKFK